MGKMDNKKHEQLEETFGLPHLKDLENDEFSDIDDDEYGFEYDEDDHEDDNDLSPDELEKKISSLKKQLSEQQEIGHISIENNKKYNKDVDALFVTAHEGYETLLSAALAMEPAQGAKFLNAAAKLLEIALKSKNSSMEKQIDMAKLQLEREKIQKGGSRLPTEYDIDEDEESDTPKGTGQVYDRNELLKAMKNKHKKDGDDEKEIHDEDEVE